VGLLSRDTAPEIQRRQFEIWRRMTPAEKLELVGQMRDTVLALARADIRQRHPDATERECFLRLMQRTLGPELARKAYPELESFDPRAR